MVSIIINAIPVSGNAISVLSRLCSVFVLLFCSVVVVVIIFLVITLYL